MPLVTRLATSTHQLPSLLLVLLFLSRHHPQAAAASASDGDALTQREAAFLHAPFEPIADGKFRSIPNPFFTQTMVGHYLDEQQDTQKRPK